MTHSSAAPCLGRPTEGLRQWRQPSGLGHGEPS